MFRFFIFVPSLQSSFIGAWAGAAHPRVNYRDATEQGEITEVLNETVKADCIYWTKQAQRQVYSEPDFEEKWDDYMIEEGA